MFSSEEQEESQEANHTSTLSLVLKKDGQTKLEGNCSCSDLFLL